jgi:hypothetical protein
MILDERKRPDGTDNRQFSWISGLPVFPCEPSRQIAADDKHLKLRAVLVADERDAPSSANRRGMMVAISNGYSHYGSAAQL